MPGIVLDTGNIVMVKSLPAISYGPYVFSGGEDKDKQHVMW